MGFKWKPITETTQAAPVAGGVIIRSIIKEHTLSGYLLTSSMTYVPFDPEDDGEPHYWVETQNHAYEEEKGK